MSNFKSLISKVNTWSDFKNGLKPLSKLEKGNAFEELTKYYLLSNAVYKDKLKNVWLQKEIPPSVTKKLNLPSNDQGIDLIAENNDGTFWAIQCKYLQDEEQRLSHRAISTFTSLSKLTAKNISYCLVATTADDYAKLYKGNNEIGFINADEWNKLNKEFFTNVRTAIAGKEIKYKPYKPKSHQQKALKEASEHFLKQKNNRGKLVFPCGAGKSLTGYWIKQALNAQSTIVAVPSLSLVKQTLEVYLRESVANKKKIEWLCVCSDEGIGKNDDVVVHTNEIGVPCITDKNFIANWIKENKKNKTVIFTTYQSGKTIVEAAKIAKAKFDLGIMDEAHKTVGNQDKLFSYLLFDKNIKIDKRIFMTATERRYAGSSDNILSMDDVEVYGETFTQMPFKDAINQDILSDYKIITLFISDKEVKEIIEKNAFVKPQGKEWDKETEARTLASMVALRKAMVQFPIHHAVTFHSSIKKAEAFEQSQVLFSEAFPEFQNIDSFHVSGAMPTSQRSKIVNEFATSNKAIITNAKCLTEGVDVPNIDCVLFADPRKSTVDIVQAVGRALRKKEGKQFGYVILPVFTKSKTKEEIIESAEFKEILSTLRALASNDERIIEYFRDISKKGKSNSSNGLVQFDIDENIIERISEKDLIDSLQLKTWDKLAKLSWMPFEEAREYVQKLKFKSTKDWFVFAKSKKKPLDLPSFPNELYKIKWKGYGDFLGTGTIATQDRVYLSFDEARDFVRTKNIKSTKEWKVFCKNGEKPNYIPAAPDLSYKNSGWISWGDFLGHDYIVKFDKSLKSFLMARKFARNLKIKNLREWNLYWKNNIRDKSSMPSNPQLTFKEHWKGWGDFLGNDNESMKTKEFVLFDEARKFALSLKLNSSIDWKKMLKENKIPNNIPRSPSLVYKNKGWISWGHFLGTNIIQPQLFVYRKFTDARKYAQKLNLKSINDWNDFVKSGKKPDDIPNAPHMTKQYKNEWVSWGDFLGTSNVASFNKVYRNFVEARKYIHTLGLKSFADWNRFCKSGKRPDDIPYHPERNYKSEWLGFEDFIGVQYKVEFVSFSEARKFARNLNLNTTGWREFVVSGKKPKEIPSNPDKAYSNSGWNGWADFLGNVGIERRKPNKNFISFDEAKDWFRKNKINSVKEWLDYIKTNGRLDYIPYKPHVAYKNKGWKGWADFLGKAKK